MIAVVTGASSGIGWATAEEFARQKGDVAVLARRKDLLDKLVDGLKKIHSEGKFRAYQCDVSSWEQSKEVADKIAADFGAVNFLINNAGAFEYASLEKSKPENLDAMINVNLKGVIYMTKAFLPHLKKTAENGPAKVVNVSSIGGLWGMSNMAIYSATKFAVTGFSSALRRELRSSKIDVASIHPGPVRNREVAPGTPKKWSTMLPDQIARQIFDLSTGRRGRRISHPVFSLLNALEYFSPAVVDKIQKKIL